MKKLLLGIVPALFLIGCNLGEGEDVSAVSVDELVGDHPLVLSSNPLPNAKGIWVNNPIKVEFSEAINPATVSAQSVTIKDGQGNDVNCSYSLDSSGKTLTIQHDRLALKTVYRITVTKLLEDTGGAALLSDYTIDFLTKDSDQLSAVTTDGKVAVSGDGRYMMYRDILSDETVKLYQRVLSGDTWGFMTDQLVPGGGVQFGYDFDLDLGGNKLAVGLPLLDNADPDDGAVILYDTNFSNGAQYSGAADGFANLRGSSISLASKRDSFIAAVGEPGTKQVTVFRDVSGTTYAATITSTLANYGKEVVLSGDGQHMLITGDNNLTSNRVEIFDYNGTHWIFDIAIINGSEFGNKLSMNEDGTVIAISDRANSRAEIRTKQSDGSWSVDYITAPNLVGPASDFGEEAILTSDGKKVFITAKNADIENVDEGAVLVYKLDDSGIWNMDQMFTEYNLEINSNFGRHIDISNDGSTLIVSTSNDI